MAVPKPISAKERTESILVNNPLIPKYAAPSVFIKMVRTTKFNTIVTACPNKAVAEFLMELRVLFVVINSIL